MNVKVSLIVRMDWPPVKDVPHLSPNSWRQEPDSFNTYKKVKKGRTDGAKAARN